MGKSSIWQRVSKRRPCPVCEKPDWCLFAGEPSNPDAAICPGSNRRSNAVKAGWLHVLRRDGPTWSPRVRRIELSAARISAAALDFAKLAADFRAAVRPEALDKLAVALGVSVESLRRLGVGWSAKTSGVDIPDEQRGRRRAGHPVAAARRQEDLRQGRARGSVHPLTLTSPRGEGIDARQACC